MANKKISDFLLYRIRYSAATTCMILLLFTVLLFSGFVMPAGLSVQEMQSASESIHTPMLALNGEEARHLINLPYHLLQKVSIYVFGVTNLGIKLPSLVLAFISIVALYNLLRLWFRKNTGILTSIIATCSALFIFYAQLGTPDISYIFWPAILLSSTSMLAYSTKLVPLWIIISAVAGALSLYTPLLIFLILTLAFTSLLHPHARFIIFKQSWTVLALAAFIFTSLLVPIMIGIANSPQIIFSLLGLDNLKSITANELWTNSAPYMQLYDPFIADIVVPAYSVVVLLLIIIGAMQLITTKYTAKSYILSILFSFFLIGLVLGILPPAFTFIPAMVLVTYALNYIISSWYNLFPLNPYARVAGLIPIFVLITGICLSEFGRYSYGISHSPPISSVFNQDLELLHRYLSKSSNEKLAILPATNETQFYKDVAERTKNKSGNRPVIITNPQEIASIASAYTIIVAPEYKSSTTTPTDILVSPTSMDSARFFLYKNTYK
jgi:hypothetical protein